MRILFICLWGLLSVPMIGYSQTIADDFEGNGSISSWYGDDCGMDNAFANPFPQGINTSSKVLKYTDTGGTYANIGFDHTGYFDLSGQASFSLKIYLPSNSLTGNQPNQISLKLQDNGLAAPWSTQCEIIKSVNVDQWQVITFDFANDPYINLDPNSPNPISRTDFNRVVIQVNGENNNDLVTAYLDDFLFDGTTLGGSIYNMLVWSDEFNGSGAIDTSKWYHQTQLPNGTSWYNGEVQHYTDRVENSYIDNGHLYIVAKKETFTDQGQTKQYTSARLNSKFAFTNGRVEVKAKLPFGVGTWPAIWTLGKNINEPGAYWQPTFGTTGWPACGEIDIMEHWGYNQNYVQSALHTPSSSGSTVNLGGVVATDVSDIFHIYALEWTPTEMQFSIDGSVYYTYAPNPQNSSNWPYTADQYILLNIAMVGSIDPGFTESPMVLDYVRVYQEATTSISNHELLKNVLIFPNPVKDELNLQLPESLKRAMVKIYSPFGQLLKSWVQEDALLTLDWSTFTPGLYMIVVETPTDQVAYKVLKK